MAGTDTVVGSGSLMPEDMYLRKCESTCLYESPSLIYDYNRNELKKEGPVKPFFESDQKRERTNSNFLTFRDCGKRTYTEPWLPDGTFLDHQFTEKDSRSLMNGPDMRKHADQQYKRGGYYNYRSDEDFSIPESMIHPEIYRQKIRETQQQIKDRMNIFSTAEIGWHNGGVTQKSLTAPHPVDSTIASAEVNTIADLSLANRASKTHNLSNDTSIGWRRSVDHKFKVAHYGQTRGSRSFADQDFYKNRGSAKTDHESDYLYVEESPVPKPTADMIVNLAEQRRTALEAGSHVKFSKSKKGKVMKRKLTQDDMILAQSKFVKVSQKRCANDILDILGTPNKSVKVHSNENIQNFTIINQRVVEKMASAPRTLTHKIKDDLRGEIRQSASDKGIYIQETNKSTMQAEKIDPQGWRKNTLYNYKKGTSKKVHVYGMGKYQKTGNDMVLADVDQVVKNSHENYQHHINMKNAKVMQKGDTFEAQDVNVFKPHQIGHKGKMGNKSIARYNNVRDHNYESGISEVESRPR
jgi:hypothetical protein